MTTPPRRTRPLRLALAVAVAAALAVAGCGGSDDDATETTTTTTAPAADDGATTEADDDDTTTTEEEAPPTTEGEDEDEDEPDGDVPTGDLQDALLTLDDVPDGYTAEDDESDEGGMTDDEPLCEGGEAVAFEEPVEEAGRQLTAPDYAVFVGSLAARFAGDGAAGAMDLYRSEVERCQGVGTGGQTYTLTDLDGVGDDALVLDLEGEGFEGRFWVARVGDVLLAVSIVGEADVLDGEALLGTVVDRL